MERRGPVDALLPHVPRVALAWMRDHPERRRRSLDSSLLMIDVSGFTALSERLARKGKVGAEELTAVISTTFAELLQVAYRVGGSLVKFGGDALLLLYEGPDHGVRAAHAAAGMHAALRAMGAVETGAGSVRLQMSAGIGSGTLHAFLVGESHRELLLLGPAVSDALRAEAAARPGSTVLAPAAAAQVPATHHGARVGDGVELRGIPDAELEAEPPEVPVAAAGVEALIPVGLREVLASGADDAEHRLATVAFLRFDNTGIDGSTPLRTIESRLQRLMADIEDATATHRVHLLGSDVLGTGGKLILAAGVPTTLPGDDERLLVALREILSKRRRGLDLAAGVERGRVYSGSVGPPYRKTYTVMGDAVNTAARIMARAEPGQLLASPAVLERSSALFATEPVEAFAAKGKSEPLRAAVVGDVVGVRTDREVHLPLVGRGDELARLRRALGEAVGGTGAMLAVTGEAGIGKTRLVAALTDGAELPVIRVEGQPFASERAYHVLGALVRLALGLERPTARSLGRRVAEIAAELEDLLPLIATVVGVDVPDTPQTAALDPAFRRNATERALRHLLEQALPRAVFVIEDADWADASSRSGLRFLAGSSADRCPWLLLLTARSADAYAEAEEIPLPPLSDADARRLAVEAAGGSLLSHDAARIADRGGGNPLFVIELVRQLAEGGSMSDDLEAVISARIDDLAPSQRGLLRRLAVLGRRFSRRLASALGDDAPDALAGLGRFLEVNADEVAFRQGLYQEVAYEGLPYATRRRLHREVGCLLEDLGETRADVLSMHFARAGDPDRTWRYARSAAGDAAARAAYDEAAILYRRALRAAPRTGQDDDEMARVWLALGEAEARTGRTEQAAEAYRTGRRRAADPALAALLCQREGYARGDLGDRRRALLLFRRGLRLLDDAGLEDGRWRLSAGYGATLRKSGQSSGAEAWARRALAEAEREGDPAAVGHACVLMDLCLSDRRAPEARAYAERAATLFQQAGERTFAATALNNLADQDYTEGRLRHALERFTEAAETLEELGNVVNAAVVRANIASILSDLGRFTEARAMFHEVLPTLRATGIRHVVAWALRNVGHVTALAGDHEEADVWFAEAIEAAVRSADAATARLWWAESRAMRGQLEAAVELCGAVDEVSASARPVRERVLAWIASAQGDRARAVEHLLASLEASREASRPLDAALALRALAALAPDEGYEADADALLSELCVVALPPLPTMPSPER